MEEKYTADEYIKKLKRLKDNLIKAIEINDSKEKYRFKAFKDFKESFNNYKSQKNYKSIDDYSLPQVLDKPIRESYPPEPSLENKEDYIAIPNYRSNIIRYVLVFIVSLSFFIFLFHNLAFSELNRVAKIIQERQNSAIGVSFNLEPFTPMIISYLANIAIQGLMLKNKKIGIVKGNSKKRGIFINVIYFFTYFLLIFTGLYTLERLLLSDFSAMPQEIYDVTNKGFVFKRWFQILVLPLSLIPAFLFELLNRYFYKKDYKEELEVNEKIRKYNEEVDQFNKSYNERMDKYKSICKKIDDDYENKRIAYDKSLYNYNMKRMNIQYEIDNKNEAISKQLKDEFAFYKSKYEKLLKNKVNKYQEQLKYLFKEIESDLEGNWLPRDYWNLYHIEKLLKYFLRRNAYTMQEASNQIREDERTDLIIENQNKLMQDLTNCLDDHLKNISEKIDYSNSLQKENIVSINNLNEQANVVNGQLNLMRDNQEEFKQYLESIDLNTFKNLCQTKITNFELGITNFELGMLNYQQSVTNDNLKNIDKNAARIYNSYYGK